MTFHITSAIIRCLQYTNSLFIETVVNTACCSFITYLFYFYVSIEIIYLYPRIKQIYSKNKNHLPKVVL